MNLLVVPQDIPHEAKACEGAEAEPPNSSVDPPANWQHHPVRSHRYMRWTERRMLSRRIDGMDEFEY